MCQFLSEIAAAALYFPPHFFFFASLHQRPTRLVETLRRSPTSARPLRTTSSEWPKHTHTHCYFFVVRCRLVCVCMYVCMCVCVCVCVFSLSNLSCKKKKDQQEGSWKGKRRKRRVARPLGSMLWLHWQRVSFCSSYLISSYLFIYLFTYCRLEFSSTQIHLQAVHHGPRLAGPEEWWPFHKPRVCSEFLCCGFVS